MAESTIKIFISYAHEDTEYKNELINHLSALTRLGIIASWHDSQILPGNKFDGEILTALENSNLIIFLISSDFIASDYIYNTEIKKALERESKGEVKILPILVRNCDFLNTPLSTYKILPDDATSVKSWNDRDEAWANVVNGLKHILNGNEKLRLGAESSTNQILLNETKKNKGCSIQIFVSLCLVGVIIGIVYFNNSGITKSSSKTTAADTTLAIAPMDTMSVKSADTISNKSIKTSNEKAYKDSLK